MKHFIKKTIFLGFFGILFVATVAQAWDVLLIGGPTISDPSFTQNSVGNVTVTDSATASGVGYTIGALVRYPLNDVFQLESGLTYLQRNYTISVVGSIDYSFDETLKGIHVPLLVRARFIENLTGGVGFYFVHELGDVYDTNVKADGQAQPDQPNSYDQDQYSRNDFGLESSIAYDIPITSRTASQDDVLYSATIDIRYLFGLTNFGTNGSSASLNSRDLMLMAGLKASL